MYSLHIAPGRGGDYPLTVYAATPKKAVKKLLKIWADYYVDRLGFSEITARYSGWNEDHATDISEKQMIWNFLEYHGARLEELRNGWHSIDNEMYDRDGIRTNTSRDITRSDYEH